MEPAKAERRPDTGIPGRQVPQVSPDASRLTTAPRGFPLSWRARIVPRLPAGEGEMSDAAGGADRLDAEALVEALQPIPEPLPAPEDDRHHRDVHVVDQVGGEELADGGWPSADADVE